MQLTFHLARAVRQLPAIEISVGCGWLLTLVLLEIVGRSFTSDLADGLALLGLSLLVYLTSLIHGKRSLHAAAAIGTGLQFLSNAFWQWTVDVGIDLKRSPPIPRGLPYKWRAAVGFLAVSAPGLMLFAPAFPRQVRSALASRCYLACLALETLLWGAMTFLTFLYASLIWARVHDWLVERHRDEEPRSIRVEVYTTLAIFGSLLIASAMLPLWIPLAIQMLLLFTCCTALLASRRGLDLMWRYHWGSPIRVFDARWLYWTISSGSSLLAIGLIVIAGGDSLGDWLALIHPGAAKVTSLLGRIFAWIAIAGNFAVGYFGIRYAALGLIFHEPRFWLFRGPAKIPEDRQTEFQNRREIVRRLKFLLRRAARQPGHRGTGLWIGIQHWFVLGLSRDDEGNEDFDRETTIFDEIIGPPYHKVFSSQSRRYYCRITEALQVDLIFLENGVGIQRFVRVLRMLFEIYDIYGGRQRAEEMHFTGLPGIHVMFQEFELGDAMRHGRARYPEPEYDAIGRLRIMHVFQDRGDANDRVSVPNSWERVPLGSGV